MSHVRAHLEDAGGALANAGAASEAEAVASVTPGSDGKVKASTGS